MDFRRGEIKEKDPHFWQGFILRQNVPKAVSQALSVGSRREVWGGRGLASMQQDADLRQAEALMQLSGAFSGQPLLSSP